MRCKLLFVIGVLINAYVTLFMYTLFFLSNLYAKPDRGMCILDGVIWCYAWIVIIFPCATNVFTFPIIVRLFIL
jgi:hypothetical protein